jgi:4,5-epoxidase
VRKAAGISFPGRKLIERLLMVDVHADWPYDHNGSTTWMDTGRMLSVTALPDDVWRVFVEPSAGVPDNLSEPEITDLVLGEFARRSGISIDPEPDVRWASEFRIHRRLAETYRRGRILLAGDAAHIQSPSGGQGQNTGLGDAENLGWKLVLVARGLAADSLLDTYGAERRPLARKVLAATTAAVDFMLPDTWWRRVVRDWLIMPALRVPTVRRRLLEAASQLGINYRSGPLASKTHWWARAPRPGDRVPDVSCRGFDGTSVTLHSAIAGCWVVLAPTPDNAARFGAAAKEVLGTDLVNTLVPVRAMGRDVLLIRPDGHVAWRGHRAPEQLSAWLKEVLWPNKAPRAVHATPATMPRSSTPHST